MTKQLPEVTAMRRRRQDLRKPLEVMAKEVRSAASHLSTLERLDADYDAEISAEKVYRLAGEKERGYQVSPAEMIALLEGAGNTVSDEAKKIFEKDDAA